MSSREVEGEEGNEIAGFIAKTFEILKVGVGVFRMTSSAKSSTGQGQAASS
jgi:hypothetical protein